LASSADFKSVVLRVRVLPGVLSRFGKFQQKYCMEQLKRLTDAELIRTVSQFKNAKALRQHYGYKSASSYTKYVLPRLNKLGFKFKDVGRKFTDCELKKASINAKSITDVCRYLGVDPTGRTHNHISKRLASIGLKFDTKTKFGATNPRKRDIQEYLVLDGPPINTSKLKKKLIKEGLIEEKCGECGLDPIWQDKPLVLHLDHIDGNRKNNVINNLRLLCPNCHSQTPTYARIKWPKRKLRQEQQNVSTAGRSVQQ
jgi:hypothetical protein